MLRLEDSQIPIFISNLLKCCSLLIIICSMPIQNIAAAIYATFLCSHWILEKEGGFLLAD
jgi:hypothetical protein